MKIRAILTACLLLCSMSAAHAELKEGVDYTIMKQPIPQLNPNKIEVLEFFAYFCAHCQHLEPILLKHIHTVPSDVYFRQEHVVWEQSLAAINMARIAAAVNASGTLYQANPAIFKAMFARDANNQPLYNLSDAATFKRWAASQGAWGQAVIRAFDSPTNMAEAKNMEKMTYKYGIGSTPQLIVGGKYQLNLSSNLDADMPKLDELIAKVRKERHMSTPQPRKAAVGTGASLAAKANH